MAIEDLNIIQTTIHSHVYLNNDLMSLSKKWIVCDVDISFSLIIHYFNEIETP